MPKRYIVTMQSTPEYGMPSLNFRWPIDEEGKFLQVTEVMSLLKASARSTSGSTTQLDIVDWYIKEPR